MILLVRNRALEETFLVSIAILRVKLSQGLSRLDTPWGRILSSPVCLRCYLLCDVIDSSGALETKLGVWNDISCSGL